MAGTPSIADEYDGFDTFQEAMLEHADRRKREGKLPQAWNPWLKEAAEIAREAGIPDAPSGAGVGNRQFSDIRKLVNSAAFGPDWQQQVSRDNPDVKRLENAARAQRAEEVAASRAQPVPKTAAAPTAQTAVALPRSGVAAVRGSVGGVDPPPLSLADQARDPVVTALDAALAAAADDLVGAPSQLGAVVPPLPDAEQEDQDRAAVRTLDPEVQGMIDEDDPGASETTSVFENRLGGLMTRLEDAGHEPNVVRAAGVAEAMARRCLKDWTQDPEGAMATPGIPIHIWALARLSAMVHLEQPSLAEAEGMCLALTRYARLTQEQRAAQLRALQAFWEIQEGEAAQGGPNQRTSDEATVSRGSPPPPSSSDPPTTPSRKMLPKSEQATPDKAMASALMEAVHASSTQLQESIRSGQEQLAEALASISGPRDRGDPSPERGRDNINALVGFKFEQALPRLKDSDTDFESHWLEFQSIMDCHAHGRRAVRPLEVLIVYRKSLADGSVRQKIYDNIFRRARKARKHPEKAAEVLEEVKKKVKNAIRETDFQKTDRVDKEFQQLEQGKLSHTEFRAEWEEKLDELGEVGIKDVEDPPTLKRKYLSKINKEMRLCILSNVWPLDGEGKPPRKPDTWEEVAE